MEMGGKVSLVCEKTGYRADLEFKLKVSEGQASVSDTSSWYSRSMAVDSHKNTG